MEINRNVKNIKSKCLFKPKTFLNNWQQKHPLQGEIIDIMF